MAEFAPVCPVHILEGLSNVGNDVMGSYHLPLAHDVLRHPEAYRRLFDREEYAHDVVILDNSVIELGTAVDIRVIAEAAGIVGANVIVLPDVLLNAGATIIECRKALSTWAIILDAQLDWEYSFMIVPQGTTPTEWAVCAEAFADDERIGWWGIPRNYNVKGLGSRIDAVKIAQTLNCTRRIHLLGFSNNIIDDVLTAQEPGVDGIDSAVPIRAASLGLEMSLGLDDNLPPRGEWWDDPKTQYVDLMADNVKKIRKWVE